MLQLKEIRKEYTTGSLHQKALDGVSLDFRDNEFVAILGPSGSGKTTLLNIIGGLDQYDNGELRINNISTKEYKERDWDTYRNHSIGFVFQSYNLIEHQSILANVELALTISGMSKDERVKKAKEALDRVGLLSQAHKKPNQMSGGQMQRVAIARALVNDPDILLADEPTGALDSETSIQVMELLREVAKDRLVIMVTHNPELANEYATRIVKLKDGKVIDDSNPFDGKQPGNKKTEKTGKKKKTSMSLLTSFALSFNNLKTKKGRTILTAFAGSIGIIGIALILSLSNGVNNYMSDIQKKTMTSYPIEIQQETIDKMSMFGEKHNPALGNEAVTHDLDGVYSSTEEIQSKINLSSMTKKNNLAAFKEYLDNPDCEIRKYIGETGIIYSYNTSFSVYAEDPAGEFINTDGSGFEDDTENEESSHAHGFMSMASGGSTTNENENFSQLIPGTADTAVNNILKDNFDVVYGNWPENKDEVILCLDENNEISATALYELGILPAQEYRDILKNKNKDNVVSFDSKKYSFEELCDNTFYLIPAWDTYIKNSRGTFDYIGDSLKEMKSLKDQAIQLKIVGIVKPNNEENSGLISTPVGYTYLLTQYLMDCGAESEIVKAQQSDSLHNVLNNTLFEPQSDADKINDAKNYLTSLGVTEKANLARQIIAMEGRNSKEMQAKSETELASMLDMYLQNPEDDELIEMYDELIKPTTYEENLGKFGAINAKEPVAISIYADSFENKEAISKCIEEYNKTASEDDQITYVDYVATLMSSVTTIIDVISYVLIAFVAVSLIVSSIMIGIITYISVLERTKEIGILRAIGASRRHISQVFTAETMIIGLISGVLGIGIAALLLVPGNMIIQSLIGSTAVNAQIPVLGGLLLVGLSVLLTIIGGIIPSMNASRKDPVTALRSE